MCIRDSFLHILLITSPTPIGLTAPSPLSRGMRRLATSDSMVKGSIYYVHKVFAFEAIASHSFVDDCFNDLQASIRLKPFVSTPQGPQNLLFLKQHVLAMARVCSKFCQLLGLKQLKQTLRTW